MSLLELYNKLSEDFKDFQTLKLSHTATLFMAPHGSSAITNTPVMSLTLPCLPVA